MSKNIHTGILFTVSSPLTPKQIEAIQKAVVAVIKKQGKSGRIQTMEFNANYGDVTIYQP